jgi:molybdopterin-guanine dinucleotide biosynthesis protein A
MAAEKYPVLVLAGGPTPDKILAAGETERQRAFINIGGRPMVQWVLEAVRACPNCGEMLLVGDVERMNRELGVDKAMLMADKGSMLENFMAGMERFRKSPLAINMTCDIPLITGPMLVDLLKQVSAIDAEIYYPIVDVKFFDAKFPGGKRTTQKLKEGTFTGGNVFVVSPEAILRNKSRIEAVIRDRKSPARLVMLFGLPFIIRFALQQLDLSGLEAKASEILGSRMRGVMTPHPEIGFDVDKPGDLNMVREIVARTAVQP